MQYKTILNPNFVVAMSELQDAFLEGWRIDTDNYPAHNLVYFEINLVKDDKDQVKEVFQESAQKTEVKRAGRPPKGAQ